MDCFFLIGWHWALVLSLCLPELTYNFKYLVEAILLMPLLSDIKIPLCKIFLQQPPQCRHFQNWFYNFWFIEVLRRKIHTVHLQTSKPYIWFFLTLRAKTKNVVKIYNATKYKYNTKYSNIISLSPLVCNLITNCQNWLSLTLYCWEFLYN